jgi:hypothetical protein
LAGARGEGLVINIILAMFSPDSGSVSGTAVAARMLKPVAGVGAGIGTVINTMLAMFSPDRGRGSGIAVELTTLKPGLFSDGTGFKILGGSVDASVAVVSFASETLGTSFMTTTAGAADIVARTTLPATRATMRNPSAGRRTECSSVCWITFLSESTPA